MMMTIDFHHVPHDEAPDDDADDDDALLHSGRSRLGLGTFALENTAAATPVSPNMAIVWIAGGPLGEEMIWQYAQGAHLHPSPSPSPSPPLPLHLPPPSL